MVSEIARAPDLQRNVHCLFGLAFDAIGLDAAVRHVRRCADERIACFISTPNVNWVVAAQADTALRDSVWQSDLSLADGNPIVRAARRLGIPILERVAGADLFERLREPRRDGPPLKLYLFGGPQGVAERAAAVLNAEQGGLRCVGAESPGFGSVEDMSHEQTVARINASGADFVVVALGASKGQAWIQRNRSRLDAPLLCHLGAVVNFVAGNVARAPAQWQRLGLEWLWRIRQEPVLWRRYRHDGLVWLRLLATQVLPALWPRSGPPPAVQSRIDVARLEDRVRLTLHGTWTLDTLTPLRAALTNWRSAGVPIEVDLCGVSACDSALVGLLALAAQYQPTLPLIRHDAAVGAAVRRAFRTCGAMHLI